MTSTATLPPAIGTADALKLAMRKMPSPVALVSTTDPTTGKHAGLAVTAFLPVCMEPPSMLVCVNRSASAYPMLERVDTYCINILGASQSDRLAAFADPTRRDERFAGEHWQGRHGTVCLVSALANLFCRKVSAPSSFGTHSLLIGEVFDVALAEYGQPALWYDGGMVPLDLTKID